MQLPFNSIKAAGKNISQILGIEPLNDIEKVDENAKNEEQSSPLCSVLPANGSYIKQ